MPTLKAAWDAISRQAHRSGHRCHAYFYYERFDEGLIG